MERDEAEKTEDMERIEHSDKKMEATKRKIKDTDAAQTDDQ